jgi:hypothetical protein
MKRKRGISLIVLVITIIVIIILAGAVILNLLNNNLIEQANKAVFKSNAANYSSELSLVLASNYSQDYSFNKSTFNAGKWDGNKDNIEGTIKQYITSMTVEDGAKFEIQQSKLVYIGSVQEEKDQLAEVGIPSGESTILGVNVIALKNTTVNGKAEAYNNPIIPKGFKAINDGAVWPTDWNKGLVIEDANGSQFVWVPVDGTNVKYAKWTSVGLSYSSMSTDNISGISSEITQITKYGGFYIARFETGYVNGKFVSKKNIAVWVNDDYINARNRVVGMYNTAEVKSGLVTGTQWDTVLRWISNDSGPNVIDSRAWGNYADAVAPANVSGFGTIQVTGYSENWKAKNIYDMAGNTREWINEIYSTYRVYIGGYSSSSGSGSSAAYRGYNPPTAGNAVTSFRAVLYVL